MKQLIILVPDGHHNLSSIVGSYKIFTRANEYWKTLGRKPVFDIRLAGTSKRVDLYDGLFSVRPHMSIKDVSRCHLVIIPSLNHQYEEVAKKYQGMARWIKQQYEKGAEIASICTGAFLLAASGLLDGKSCSTHWSATDSLRTLFPYVRPLEGKLITDEKGIYTNGGAYSFLNLILYLIEKYYDRPTAIYCSKVFQIDMSRDSQSPFMIFSRQKGHDDDVVYQAQQLMEKDPSEHYTIKELASKYAVSRRSFDRRFINATGNTPLEYLQRIRIEASKKALENSRKTVNEVMYEAGYQDAKAFREVFRKVTGLSPLDYRRRYHKD
jgi:transcriptional regulator GlxA family with amidase domain